MLISEESGSLFPPAHSGVPSTVTGERTSMLTSMYDSVCLTGFWPSIIKSCLVPHLSRQNNCSI